MFHSIILLIALNSFGTCMQLPKVSQSVEVIRSEPDRQVASTFDSDVCADGRKIGSNLSPSFSDWLFVTCIDDLDLPGCAYSDLAAKDFRQIVSFIDRPSAHLALKGTTLNSLPTAPSEAASIALVLEYRAWVSDWGANLRKESVEDEHAWLAHFDQVVTDKRDITSMLVLLGRLQSIPDFKVRVQLEKDALTWAPSKPVGIRKSILRHLGDDLISSGNYEEAKIYLQELASAKDGTNWKSTFFSKCRLWELKPPSRPPVSPSIYNRYW